MESSNEIQCPRCQAVFEAGPREREKTEIICPTCGGAVSEPGSPNRDSRMVSVYVPGDEGEHMALVSLLEGSGIRCYSKNANVQSLFGAGLIGAGYNVAAGRVQIQVMQEDEARAKEVIAAYQASDSTAGVEYEIPERCPACDSLTRQERQCPDCGLVFVPDSDRP